MFKAWLNMWRNTFNYTGRVSQKDYWFAIILNILTMYIFAVPLGFIAGLLNISPLTIGIVYMILCNIPTLSLYFRRANDANWKLLTTLYLAIVTPIISGFVVGRYPSLSKESVWPRIYSVSGKLFALSFGLFFYGGVLGIIFFDDPTALPYLNFSGIALGTITLIYVGIKSLFGNASK